MPGSWFRHGHFYDYNTALKLSECKLADAYSIKMLMPLIDINGLLLDNTRAQPKRSVTYKKILDFQIEKLMTFPLFSRLKSTNTTLI